MGFTRRNVIAGTAALLPAAVLTAGSGSAESPLAKRPKGRNGSATDRRSESPPVCSEAFARHAVGVNYTDIDKETVRAATLRVLDLIGSAIGGAPAVGNAALAEVVNLSAGGPQASIIGYPVRGTAADVAMANAIIARSYDFEVMTVIVEGKATPSHHSPTTCMTALALSERERRSGRDFLTALIVGDDIAARLLAASGIDFEIGWDGSPVFSALGATAIAARFANLSPVQARDAFGMAVDQIGGTVQNIWDAATDFKLPQGAVARNAILSADLAARGWTGMDDAVLSPFGLFGQYTSGCTDPGLLMRDLGQKFYGEGYFKPYPACMATHPSIDCALALRSKYALDPANIQQVTVRLPSGLLANFCGKPFEVRRFPHADANFSYQFQTANALLRGSIRQEHYAEKSIQEPELLALISKTSLAQLAPGKSGVEIEVVTKDGQTLIEAHGPLTDRHPLARPSTPEDIVAKFYQQVEFSDFVSRQHAAEIIDRIDRLEDEQDMSVFVSLLTRSYLPIKAISRQLPKNRKTESSGRKL